MTDLANATRYFSLIRSKDAGPFMLTIDLFFADADVREAFISAGVFSAGRIAESGSPGAIWSRKKQMMLTPTTTGTT